MTDITAKEQKEREAALETEAATLLGRMLFEFSRLHLNLSLCLAWANSGADLEAVTHAAVDCNMKTKLDDLAIVVARKLPPDSDGCRAFRAWLNRAHRVRVLRNELVHGRWGVDGINNRVVIVVDLPTAGTQKEVTYSLDELSALLEKLLRLQSDFAELRERWRL